MKREYFCGGCGLFHWAEQYKEDEETGRIDRVPYEGCPNIECVSYTDEDVPFFAVDTMGYYYFSENNSEFITRMNWSSPKYAPEHAIKYYEAAGVRIER